MLGLLYRIFIGSFEKRTWKIIETGDVTYYGKNIGRFKLLQCEQTGKLKYFKYDVFTPSERYTDFL